MSNYAAVETSALAILKGLDQFGDRDVTQADWAILTSRGAGASQLAVLWMGSFTAEEYGTSGFYLFRWVMMVDLFQRYTAHGTSFVDFQTTRQNVIDEFMKYPSMNSVSGVIYVLPARASAPTFIRYENSDQPQYIKQTLEVLVHQTISLSGEGEFA